VIRMHKPYDVDRMLANLRDLRETRAGKPAPAHHARVEEILTGRARERWEAREQVGDVTAVEKVLT
jgi:hypothetical protein